MALNERKINFIRDEMVKGNLRDSEVQKLIGIMKRGGDPLEKIKMVSMQDELKKVKKKLVPTGFSAVNRAQKKWEEVVGFPLIEQTSVVKLKTGTMTIRVSSSALKMELEGYFSNELLEALSEGDSGIPVKKLKFIIGDTKRDDRAK